MSLASSLVSMSLDAETLVWVSLVVPSSVWKLVPGLVYCLLELSALKWVFGCWDWKLVGVMSAGSMWAAAKLDSS